MQPISQLPTRPAIQPPVIPVPTIRPPIIPVPTIRPPIIPVPVIPVPIIPVPVIPVPVIQFPIIRPIQPPITVPTTTQRPIIQIPTTRPQIGIPVPTTRPQIPGNSSLPSLPPFGSQTYQAKLQSHLSGIGAQISNKYLLSPWNYFRTEFKGNLPPNSPSPLSWNNLLHYSSLNQGGKLYSLLLNQDPSVLLQITQQGGYSFVAPLSTFVDFLWYVANGTNPRLNLTQAEKDYISKLSVADLRAQLADSYYVPDQIQLLSHAELLYALLFGVIFSSSLQIKELRLYDRATNYPLSLVKFIYNKGANIMDWLAPYRRASLLTPGPGLTVMLAATEANFTQLAGQYQVVFSPDITPTLNMFYKSMLDYEFVFKRQPGFAPRAILLEIQRSGAFDRDFFEECTDLELVLLTEVKTWRSRARLTDQTIELFLQGEQWWTDKHRWCTNDNTLNPIADELHADMNKDDPNNPTLSFGRLANYRCYQADELTASFHTDDNGIFRFYAPDWSPSIGDKKGAVDLATGESIPHEFPFASISKLQLILKDDTRPAIVRLHAKITQGLQTFNLEPAAKILRAKYSALPPRDQRLVRLYLVWLFMFAMRLRYWEGPGNPWPTDWDEMDERPENCDLTREEDVIIAGVVRTNLIEEYEVKPDLNSLIVNFPLVAYDLQQRVARRSLGDLSTVNNLLDRLALGAFCLTYSSDLLAQSAYYLIENVIGAAGDKYFNDVIRENMSAIIEIETAAMLSIIQNAIKANEAVEARSVMADANARANPGNPAMIAAEIQADRELRRANFKLYYLRQRLEENSHRYQQPDLDSRLLRPTGHFNPGTTMIFR